MGMHIDELSSHRGSVRDRDGGAFGCPLATRDVLDAAVRCLAVSPEPLAARAEAAVAAISSGLPTRAVADSEERELLRRILASTGLACAARPGGRESSGREMSDATAQIVASDIVDLRDTVMGRAIRSARTSTRDRRLSRPRSLKRHA
jgi:hypothetical protein